MTAKKTPSTTASKSTELTDAPETTVLTNNSNNSMQANNPINSTTAVNGDNAVNSTTTVNPNNLFGSDQTSNEVTAQPKQQRIGKQQRKSDYADFKAAYLTPAKLEKRTRSTSRTTCGRSWNASPVSSVTATPA